MANRWREWLKQAEHELCAARDLHQAGHSWWACFTSQQSAEKAVKAIHAAHGQDIWGHVIVKLLEQVPPGAPRPTEQLLDAASVLDSYYIPTRYPGAHEEGPPAEHYRPRQSEEAIHFAEQILHFARQALEGRP